MHVKISPIYNIAHALDDILDSHHFFANIGSIAFTLNGLFFKPCQEQCAKCTFFVPFQKTV